MGQILIEKNLVSSTDIARAMGELTTKAEEEEMLGESLVADKIITGEQLKKAREKQKTAHQRLTKTLTSLGFVRPEEIAKQIGKYWGISYISLTDFKPNPDIMQMIPEDFMRRHQLIPIKLEGNTLVVAMSDPLNIIAIDEIRLLTNYQVEIMVTTEKEISLVLNRYFTIQKVAREV
ncbi:unnamed protein product, partial [marine sediment metagenome]